MTSYHQHPPVLEAAALWRERCLLEDGSILSERRLWRLENFAQLDRYFVQNPDLGESKFLAKLEGQIAPASGDAKQLAAEILWLLYLGVSHTAMKGATKRLQIKQVWDWSGEPFPSESVNLRAPLESGIANPGTAYQAQRWREFAFAVEFARDWKRLQEPERRRLAGDPWQFAAWLDGLPSSPGRQLRHMLLALLFPEHFERVVTAEHKRRIVGTFLPKPSSTG